MDKEERTKIFSWNGAVIGLALILGPAIWWRVESVWGYEQVLYVAIGISLLTLVWLTIWLEESLPPEKRISWSITIKDELQFRKKFILLNEYSQLKRPFVIYEVFWFVFAAFTSTNVLYATTILWFDEGSVGILYFGIGLALMIHQLITVPWCSSRYEEKTVFIVWITVLGVWLIPYFLQPWIVLFGLLAICITWWTALTFATFKTLITSEVSEKSFGAITGLDESLLAANRAIAPILMGIAFEAIASTAFWMLWVVLLGMMLLIFYQRSKSE